MHGRIHSTGHIIDISDNAPFISHFNKGVLWTHRVEQINSLFPVCFPLSLHVLQFPILFINIFFTQIEFALFSIESMIL